MKLLEKSLSQWILKNPSLADPIMNFSINDLSKIPDLNNVINQETSAMSSWDRLVEHPMIDNTETAQFGEVNKSIT